MTKHTYDISNEDIENVDLALEKQVKFLEEFVMTIEGKSFNFLDKMSNFF